jgi:hypothetical protein
MPISMITSGVVTKSDRSANWGDCLGLASPDSKRAGVERLPIFAFTGWPFRL